METNCHIRSGSWFMCFLAYRHYSCSCTAENGEFNKKSNLCVCVFNCGHRTGIYLRYDRPHIIHSGLFCKILLRLYNVILLWLCQGYLSIILAVNKFEKERVTFVLNFVLLFRAFRCLI